MTDEQARELLAGLHQYVTEYAPDIPQTILALAEDLAISFSDSGYDEQVSNWLMEIRSTEGVS